MNDATIAFIGVLLGFFLGILWDRYKSKKKFQDFIQNLKNELTNNLSRVNSTIDGLPNPIKSKLTAGSDSANFSNAEIQSVPYSFPKPFNSDVWNSLIMSGLVSNIPKSTLEKLYKIYDMHFSANYLGNLTVDFFKLISAPNSLNQDMRNNFDQFCRVGVLSQIFGLYQKIPPIVEDLERILND